MEVPIVNPSLEAEQADESSIIGRSSLSDEITENVAFERSKEKSKTGEYSLKVVDQSADITVFVQLK